MSKKPLVVIAGWLGCQQRFLKRYQTFYEHLGMRSFTVIAPPLAVVEAALQCSDDPSSNQMDAVARDVLNHIKECRPRQLVFHLFSNSGCFLWERIRHHMVMDPSIAISVDAVVFDSCPAWFGNHVSPLSSALDLCLEEEKRLVRDRFGDRIWGQETNQHRHQRKQRSQHLFDFLQRDPLDVPHLYFYCRNDVLADFSRIQQLVGFRRNHFDRSIVEKKWTSSVHCSHILQHTQEYQEILSNFLTMALGRSKL